MRKVDSDSCVNTPVVIFVEQMLLIQEIQFWRQNIVTTGIFWEIIMMARVRFLFDHKIEEPYCYLPDSYPILQAIYHQHHALRRRSTHCFLDISRPDGALSPHLYADGVGRVGDACRFRGLL
jgi:hypothetical protein